MTEWRDVPGYDRYEVNREGQVRRKAFVLSPGPIPTGHLTVNLGTGVGKTKSMYVHRLVAMAFLENPDDKPLVNHKNGNPKDNRVENLEWSTYSENNSHTWRPDGVKIASLSGARAINPETGEVVHEFKTVKLAARFVGVTVAAISSSIRRNGTCRGYKWATF